MANMIARELSQQGLKEIKVYDVSKTDSSFIMSDIWKYKGLIIGSCAHNNALYPKMQPILDKLQNYGLKNRYVGVFRKHDVEWWRSKRNINISLILWEVLK